MALPAMRRCATVTRLLGMYTSKDTGETQPGAHPVDLRSTPLWPLHKGRSQPRRPSRFAVHIYRGLEMRCGIIECIARTLLGIEPAAVRAMGPAITPCLMRFEDLAGYARHVERVRVLHPGDRETCDVRMKHRTREWRTIEIHHMALTYRLPDAPLGLIALALDATQLPQMQKAMRHDLARLARNV
jgi:hypothetical protein